MAGAILAAAVSTSACSPTRGQPQPMPSPTLYISNSGWGPVRVHFDHSLLALIENGRATCLELPPTRFRLELSVTAVAESRVLFASRIRSIEHPGWLLEIIKISDRDRVTLSPHRKCTPGGRRPPEEPFFPQTSIR